MQTLQREGGVRAQPAPAELPAPRLSHPHGVTRRGVSPWAAAPTRCCSGAGGGCPGRVPVAAAPARGYGPRAGWGEAGSGTTRGGHRPHPAEPVGHLAVTRNVPSLGGSGIPGGCRGGSGSPAIPGRAGRRSQAGMSPADTVSPGGGARRHGDRRWHSPRKPARWGTLRVEEGVTAARSPPVLRHSRQSCSSLAPQRPTPARLRPPLPGEQLRALQTRCSSSGWRGHGSSRGPGPGSSSRRRSEVPPPQLALQGLHGDQGLSRQLAAGAARAQHRVTVPPSRRGGTHQGKALGCTQPSPPCRQHRRAPHRRSPGSHGAGSCYRRRSCGSRVPTATRVRRRNTLGLGTRRSRSCRCCTRRDVGISIPPPGCATGRGCPCPATASSPRHSPVVTVQLGRLSRPELPAAVGSGQPAAAFGNGHALPVLQQLPRGAAAPCGGREEQVCTHACCAWS